jgi:hypothetical protein
MMMMMKIGQGRRDAMMMTKIDPESVSMIEIE